MSLRDLIPEVPNIPELTINSGSTGIYVVTLQLWLKMLGYDQKPAEEDDIPKPIEVNGKVDDATEEAVDRFYTQEGIDAPWEFIIDYSGWVKLDELLKDKLPPDPKTLERLPFPKREDYETEEAYSYAVRMGLEAFGFRPEVEDKKYYLEIDESGLGTLDNVPAGIYSLEMANESSKPNTELEYNEEAGSMEVRLYDENENPIKGKVKLSNETPEPESLRKLIRLFKALSRIKNELEDKENNEVNPKAIDGKLYTSNKKMWEDFPKTWGQFYGAPWMAIMFDPISIEDITIGSNFTNYDVASMLFQWGAEHLKSKAKNDYQLIGVNYLNSGQGGMVNKRSDFSQIGNSLSLHLPRGTSRKVGNIDTGQQYGDLGYDSDDYNKAAFKLMLKNQINLKSDFQIRTQDKELVASLGEIENVNEGHVTWNSKIINNADITEVLERSIQINIRFQFYVDEKDNVSGNHATNQYEERFFPVPNAVVIITDSQSKKIKARTNSKGKVKLPKRCLKQDANDPKAPYQITIKTASGEQIEQELSGTIGDQLTFDAIENYFNYLPDSVGTGLYELKDGKWKKLSGKDAYNNHSVLLENEFIGNQLISQINPIYRLESNESIVTAEDDHYDPTVRTDHYGLDLGSRILKDGNHKSLEEARKVYPIMNGGILKTDNIGEEMTTHDTLRVDATQKIVLTKDSFRLVLFFRYGHVITNQNLPLNWTPFNTGMDLGHLYQRPNKKLWTAKVEPYVIRDTPISGEAPELKGNHVHFRIEGIYDRLTGLDNNQSYNSERKTFYNSLLLPKIIEVTNEQ